MRKAYSYIRFSSAGQAGNDSYKRQFEATKSFVNQRDDLALEETFFDPALSQHHGLARIKGALGKFLGLVENGEIEKGSVLIIESLDRLSREEILIALQQFIELINAGITIVTLLDRMEYSKKSIIKNPSELIISITIMTRANEESKLKSNRIGKAKQSKRDEVRIAHDNGKSKIFTKRRPLWLSLNEDESEFTVIPEATEALKNVFELYRDGLGVKAIETKMNKDKDDNGKPIWWRHNAKKNKDGETIHWQWTHSYIRLLLSNPAVTGEFQPMKFVDVTNKNGEFIKQDRIPDGKPIPNYYPRVVSDALYYEVQQIRKNKGKQAGRGGGRVDRNHNLFTHLAKCGHCGSSLEYNRTKQNHPKFGTYIYKNLVCKYRNKIDPDGNLICTAYKIPYDEFCDLLFAKFPEFDPSRFFPGNKETQNQIRRDRDSILENKKKIEDKEKSVTRFDSLIEKHEGSDDPGKIRSLDLYDNNINKLHNEIIPLEEENKKLQENINKLSNKKDYHKERFETVTKIRERLVNSNEPDEQREIRTRINAALKSVIEEIRIWPVMPASYHKAPLDDRKKKMSEIREKGEKVSLGMKVGANFQKQKIREVEDPTYHVEAGVKFDIKTKKIDLIQIRFRGSGIVDEDGEAIKRRTVSLRRERTEDFRP